jgi:hypothetical protein
VIKKVNELAPPFKAQDLQHPRTAPQLEDLAKGANPQITQRHQHQVPVPAGASHQSQSGKAGTEQMLRRQISAGNQYKEFYCGWKRCRRGEGAKEEEIEHLYPQTEVCDYPKKYGSHD